MLTIPWSTIESALVSFFVGGGIVAAFWAAFNSVLTKSAAPAAISEAGVFGQFVQHTVLASMPAEFAPLVKTELDALAANAGADALTVKQAAAAILAKVATKVPAATITDVLDVISESTQAFVAGLAPDAPASLPNHN
jgi:hypothetical protein